MSAAHAKSASDDDETRSLVTWRTAMGALIVAVVLTAAAVGGVLLAGRGGGLGRADLVLALLPDGVTAVASADPVALRGVPAPVEAGSGTLSIPALGAVLPAEGVDRVTLFAQEGRWVGAIFEGKLRASKLPGTDDGEYQGVALRRLGELRIASLGQGRAVLGSPAVVRQVLDTSRGRTRAFPASAEFRALHDLALRARDYPDFQVVVFPLRAPLSDRARSEWPAAAAAQAVGLFSRVVTEGTELEILLLGRPEVIVQAERELGGAASPALHMEREGENLRAKSRLGRGVPVTAGARFFESFFPSHPRSEP
jgi:hypothetical protein